ncbi:hypothetical protein KUTeg_006786 [Tegillarca granosa]|uniref:small monomeric GTPase n=1 Tax=Tegillarca granosa TaxID=220873 RepID=A0ABQ9FEJ1_TEGGR|nr:hypothetical protein KUTeg_006786 [Tegillarca granosa]
MSGGSAGACDPPGSGSSLKPYLKRKKSSFGETKVALIGADGVGKSEAKYKYTTVVDGESVQFEILDTISENDDLGAREDVLRWADGFMLVYSVVSRKTFDILEDMRRKIDEAKKGTNIPLVIVEFACPFLEVSASEDVSQVNEAFFVLSREVVEFKRRTRTFLNRVFGAFGREKAS